MRAVVNQGTITVKQAGLAALVAPQVANSGAITARLGHVVLAGAKTATLDLYGDGLLSLDVTNQVTQAPVGRDGKPVTALVTNSGVILADGGTVQLTARAADGLVQNLVQAGGKDPREQRRARPARRAERHWRLDHRRRPADRRWQAPGTTGGAIEVATDGVSHRRRRDGSMLRARPAAVRWRSAPRWHAPMAARGSPRR